MRFLTLLSVQGLFIALLCSSTFAEINIPTLDGLIKLAGSLYQKKLYDVRDNSQIENLRNKIALEDTVLTDTPEQVIFPEQRMCLPFARYCVTLRSTLSVEKNTDVRNEDEKNSIRNDDYGKEIDDNDEDNYLRTCISDIVFDSCPKDIGIDDENPVLNISTLKAKDFCLPGALELNGTLDILEEITDESTIYLELNRQPKPSYRRRDDSLRAIRCIGGGDYCHFYNTCDFVERDGCKKLRNLYDNNFPCSCPVGPGTYLMDGFKKLVPDVESFGYGKVEGFVILMAKDARSCFSFSFTKTLERM